MEGDQDGNNMLNIYLDKPENTIDYNDAYFNTNYMNYMRWGHDTKYADKKWKYGVWARAKEQADFDKRRFRYRQDL